MIENINNNVLKLLGDKYLNYIVFFYILSYIFGPAIINVYITLLSIIAFAYLIYRSDLLKTITYDYSSIFLLIFFMYAFLISIVKENFNIEIISFLRITIIYIFVSLFYRGKKNYLNIKKILLFFTLLISIDSLYQFIFRENIFGYEIFEKYRLTSFFKDEPIVGSFLLKTTLPLIGFYFYKVYDNKLLLLLIIISAVTIILSGERMPLLQFFFGIFIMIFLFINKLKSFIFFISTLFLVNVSFLINDSLYERYKSTYLSISSIILSSQNANLEITNYSINEYLGNFKSGVDLWSNSKLFGNGYRYYNKNCDFMVKEPLNSGCSTHPHNIYIEILSDYGLVGLFLFISFYISIFFKFIKFNYKSDILGIGVLFFVISFPFSTSQSIFSSYYGSIYFLFAFLINYYSIIKKNINNY